MSDESPKALTLQELPDLRRKIDSSKIDADPEVKSLKSKLEASERALAAQRGGAAALSVMKLKGLVADNQAINVVTGNNTISEGAFSGAAGLPMVIQNSGNNVLIQNATIVNVHVK